MKKRELIVIGGANGSGKTTFAREVVAEKGSKYLGADDIAFELDAQNFESVKIEAARIFSKRLTECLENGDSLIIESTLSGLSLKKHLQRAKQNGYSISIFFVFLDSVELCLKRIKSRVEKAVIMFLKTMSGEDFCGRMKIFGMFIRIWRTNGR